MTAKRNSAYAAAGVDIDEMDAGLRAVKKMVEATATPGVVSGLGSFGGMFEAPGARGQVLVASTDGVGTKLKVAVMANRHNSVGQDLVNHCVNDILVQGAHPLFFLDYVGTSKLSAQVFKSILSGLCKACKANGCALLGGETAEMPGLYPEGEYDLIGTIVGAVARRDLLTGQDVKSGDAVLGLASSGLHTNGYSLARRIVFEQAGLDVDAPFPGMKRTVGQVLLTVHRSYLEPIRRLRSRVKVLAMAHITGGGLPDNLPRSLPEDVDAVIDVNAWQPPPLFRYLMETGEVEQREMYRVFNMGIGFVCIVRAREEEAALAALKEARIGAKRIGRIVEGSRRVVLEGRLDG